MHRIAVLAAGLLAAGLVAGCGVQTDSRGRPGTPEARPSGALAYFIVTREDVRRCAFPRCGGVFVKAVNQQTTVCADGVRRQECHVATVDLDALRLPQPQRAEFAGRFQQKHAIVRGRLVQIEKGHGVPVETLVASEGHRGVTQREPRGRFSQLTDNGVRCITFPCLSFVERQLNATRTRPLAEVDLAASGASDAQIARGLRELADHGILAAGRSTRVTGPAGTAEGFAASEFYVRERPGR